MAKTSAERHGGRHLDLDRRLNSLLTLDTRLALRRLARYQGIAQQKALENLVLAAEEQILDMLHYPTPEWCIYFGDTTSQWPPLP